MRCRIKKQGLQMVIDVDGKEVYPSAYMSYNPMEDNFEEFKQYGINLFMFPIYAGDEGINMETGLKPFCDNFFKDYGKYDFSYVDRVMGMIAPDGEDDIYIIPRVCIEPPKWWQNEHTEEVARDYRGETLRECFTSIRWREDMTEALKALVDHFENSVWKKNVIGYHIAAGGTEEWPYQARYAEQYYDYSLTNLKAYRLFLQNKYGSVQNLSAAWKQKIEKWEEVVFPSPVSRTYARKGFIRDPDMEMNVLDYFDFHNWSVGDTICYFCKQIKEYTNDGRITGAFYGYTMTIPKNKKGLHAMKMVINSPYVDFLSSTNWAMEPGEAWCFASAVDSARLHGKMWIAEGDIRTYCSTTLRDQMPWAVPDNDYYGCAVWKGPEAPSLTYSALTKGIARILTAPCGIWWFDMWGKWFHSPEMMDIISKTIPLLRQQKHDYFKPEVAVFIDETGHKYSGLDENKIAESFHDLISSLVHMGTPFHIYLLSDVTEECFSTEDYKLCIFLAATNPSEKEKEAIEKKIKCNKNTLLWLHTSACYDKLLCDYMFMEDNYNIAMEKAVFADKEYPNKVVPTLYFAEESGYVLSCFADSGKPAVIWKEMNDYSSVYSLHLALSPELLRHIAIMAGVHLYNREGDCIYAGGEFVAIHAVEEGCRRICLPSSGWKATNALTNEMIEVNDMFIEIRMKKYETIILHLERGIH